MLVERHATETYRLCAAIVGEADARDVAQEVFVVAWQNLPRLRQPDAFAGWLRRTSVNRCRNWLRARSRRAHTTSLGDAGGKYLPDSRRDFRHEIEARALLAPAFDRLTADQRVVLALHYSMGYSIADVSAALNLNVGTTKSRLNAGLAALRAALAADDGEPRPEVAT